MTIRQPLTPHQSQYLAWLLTRRTANDSVESLASTLVDLNPHQVDAALFACRNPLSRGVILADEVGSEHSLLVCCSAFRGIKAAEAAQRWPNLTLKKIPKMVLARCEWGHDDYSLNVQNLPMAAPVEKTPSPQPSPRGRGRKARKVAAIPDLFGDVGENGV